MDIEHFQQWVGKAQSAHDTLRVGQARLLAATLDWSTPPSEGDRLPPLWHWVYFLDAQPTNRLGADGHAARGEFLPPVPLPNRMWAGGRVRFERDLCVGQAAEKVSTIKSVTHKQGRAGDLVFVTVEHAVYAKGERCIVEEHDIVYKGANPRGARVEPLRHLQSDHRATYTPTSALLFRYSALTFNTHRIHYDLNYCQIVEGYDNLVVHGPLNATLLAAHAERTGGRHLRSFVYRGVRPALLGSALTLDAQLTDEAGEVWMADNDETVMQASVEFQT